MTFLSIAAMIGGVAALMFAPLPRDRTKRLASQGLGAGIFAIGLVGLLYSMFVPVTA